METVNDKPFVSTTTGGLSIAGKNEITYPYDLIDQLLDNPHTERALETAMTYRHVTRNANHHTWLHAKALDTFIAQATEAGKEVTIVLGSKFDSPYVFTNITSIENTEDRVFAKLADGSGVILGNEEVILAAY